MALWTASSVACSGSTAGPAGQATGAIPAEAQAPAAGGASGPTGATGAPGPVAPSGPPAPRPLAVLHAVARLAGQEALALDVGAPTRVAPGSGFEVRVGAPVVEARLVLVDGQEALVAGTSEAEIGGADARFLFTPSQPLRPGASYVLRLEGLASRIVPGPDGARYLPVSFPIAAARPGPPPAGARRP